MSSQRICRTTREKHRRGRREEMSDQSTEQQNPFFYQLYMKETFSIFSPRHHPLPKMKLGKGERDRVARRLDSRTRRRRQNKQSMLSIHIYMQKPERTR